MASRPAALHTDRAIGSRSNQLSEAEGGLIFKYDEAADELYLRSVADAYEQIAHVALIDALVLMSGTWKQSRSEWATSLRKAPTYYSGFPYSIGQRCAR